MMKYPVKMPQLTDTMTEGVLLSWVKCAGDAVRRGDIVAEIETDKAVMDVEIFKDGFLSGPLVKVGDTVTVGLPIAFVVDSKSDVDGSFIAASPADTGTGAMPTPVAVQSGQAGGDVDISNSGNHDENNGKVNNSNNSRGIKATPYARKQAAAAGVDLAQVVGSRRDIVVTAGDVAKFVDTANAGDGQLLDVNNSGDRIRPMTLMEKAVSRSMAATLAMPMFHVTININAAKLKQISRQMGCSYTIILAKAVSVAVEKHPRINMAYYPDEQVIEHKTVDIGIAVATVDQGLVVPVIRDFVAKDAKLLDQEWKELLGRAKRRRLSADEYSDPTIVLSNMGMFGVASFDAIPQTGSSVALALAAESPEGLLPVTATADHRVVNGADLAAFLKSLKETVELPAWLPVDGAVMTKALKRTTKVEQAAGEPAIIIVDSRS